MTYYCKLHSILFFNVAFERNFCKIKQYNVKFMHLFHFILFEFIVQSNIYLSNYAERQLTFTHLSCILYLSSNLFSISNCQLLHIQCKLIETMVEDE